MPARDLTASRRAALALVAGGSLAALVGCDAESPGRGGGDAGPAGSPTATAAPQDADGRLVDEVRAEVAAVLTTVRAARGRTSVDAAVRSLEALHRTHLRALDGEEPVRTPRRAPGPPAAVARRLAAREERHQRVLARATERAVSGDLAALLATMTAGVAQHRELVR